jgi:hypothetical protein
LTEKLTPTKEVAEDKKRVAPFCTLTVVICGGNGVVTESGIVVGLHDKEAQSYTKGLLSKVYYASSSSVSLSQSKNK